VQSPTSTGALATRPFPTFFTYVNEVKNRGKLSSMHGTQTKYEDVVSLGEARDMLWDDAFITEAVPRAVLLCFLRTLF